MADRRIEDIWQAAVDRYQEKTGHSLADALPNMPNQFDLTTTLARVDEDNEKYEKYKERRKSLHEALDPVLHVIGELAETAGETGAIFFPPSKAISVAVCWLVAAGKNYGARYDTIIDVFSHLSRALGRVKIHSTHDISTNLRASMVDTLGHILILLGTARKALEGGRLKQFLKIAGGKIDDLKEAMKHLERLTAREDSVVSAEALSGVNAVLDKLDQGIDAELRDSLRDISASIQTIRDEEFLEWLKPWLNAPDASYNQDRHLDSREHQTGLWFLQSSQFTEWNEVSDSLMWIQGPPGCGKSVLFSSAVEATASRCAYNSSATYLYFYFDFNDDTKQTYRGMLHWLLLQLAGSFSTIPEPLVRLRESSRHGVQSLNSKAILKVIRELCSLFSDVYLMLDALDECSSMELTSVLDFPDDLRQGDKFSLHTLVTSRPEPDIANHFKDPQIKAPVTVVVAEDIVEHDINLYIQQNVNRDPQLKRKGREVCDLIQKHLSESAKGMFRWVSLQLDQLRTCRTAGEVKKALKELPPTLAATYSRILCVLQPKDVRYVAMMLPYLIYSQRLLTMDELAAAAAVDLDSDDPFNPDNKFCDPEDVLRLCPGLVTGFRHPGGEATYVQLAHFSVREYLVSNAAHGHADRFNYQRERAHYTIFRTSLLVLNSLDELYIVQQVERQPLARHAAEFWPYHFKLCYCTLQSGSDTWLLLRHLFDSTKNYFNNWRYCYDHGLSTHKGLLVVGDPLYYASSLGVYEVCLSILDNGTSSNGGTQRSLVSALVAACVKGHAKISRLLVDRGADVNTPYGDYGSALGASCHWGHAEVAELLLDRGADMTILCGDYGSALETACRRGHTEVARLLVERGADMNISCREYGTALGAACHEGHAEVVRLLVDRGADVNIPGGYDGSALGAASYMGHTELVKLLLDRRVDINLPGGEHVSALGAACHEGHAEVAQMLVERGADMNISCGEYGSALEAACHWGHA